MPRHTHPALRRTHDRAHIRDQRHRYINRRWRQAKDRYAGDWLLVGRFGRRHLNEPSEAVADFAARTHQASAGPVFFIHPEEARSAPDELGFGPWPFFKPPGYFAHNLFCLCSCLLCSNELERIGRRSREKRFWRSEAESDADGWDGSA